MNGKPGFARLVRLAVLAGSLASYACGATQRHANDAARDESSAAMLVEHGDASASVGDMTRAEQYYVAALDAGGGAKPIVQRLLRVCVADRRYPVAAQYADQYLRRHPRDTEVQFAAASIQAALGEEERAEAMLKEVVRREPAQPEAHFALASVLRSRGAAPSEADAHDLEYLKLNPGGPLAEAARARLSTEAP